MCVCPEDPTGDQSHSNTYGKVATMRLTALRNATELAIDQALMAGEPFTLDVTRRVYAIDAMTGVKSAYFVRDYRIVGN